MDKRMNTKKFIYITLKDVQKNLESHYQRTGQKLSFVDALENVYHLGQFTEHQVKHPDYTKWDLQTPEGLWDLYSSSQLEVSTILEDPILFNSYVSETHIGFEQRDIIVNMHVHAEKAVSHSHDYFEANYILSGSADVQVNLEHITLSTGEFIVIAPYAQHKISISENTIAVVFAIRRTTFENVYSNLMRTESLISNFMSKSLYSSKQNFLCLKMIPDEYINNILRQIFAESVSQQLYANELVCSYMSILLAYLIRGSVKNQLSMSTSDTALSNMSLILSYIRNNYKTLSLTSLSQFWGYENNYLGKQLYKATGLHFNDIITNLKLEEAVRLLLNSDRRIEEIAEFCGYNSIQHFSRVFREHYHMSPSTYRKQKKEL